MVVVRLLGGKKARQTSFLDEDKTIEHQIDAFRINWHQKSESAANLREEEETRDCGHVVVSATRVQHCDIAPACQCIEISNVPFWGYAICEEARASKTAKEADPKHTERSRSQTRHRD